MHVKLLLRKSSSTNLVKILKSAPSNISNWFSVSLSDLKQTVILICHTVKLFTKTDFWKQTSATAKYVKDGFIPKQ